MLPRLQVTSAVWWRAVRLPPVGDVLGAGVEQASRGREISRLPSGLEWIRVNSGSTPLCLPD